MNIRRTGTDLVARFEEEHGQAKSEFIHRFSIIVVVGHTLLYASARAGQGSKTQERAITKGLG